jgi:hypothetical protein
MDTWGELRAKIKQSHITSGNKIQLTSHLRPTRESVRIEESTADEAHDNDTESATEDLRAITNNCPTKHSAKIRDDLGDSDLIGGEIILIGKHCRVKILQ